MMVFDIITDGPVDSGEFTLKLPVGDYKVVYGLVPRVVTRCRQKVMLISHKLLKTQPLV